MSERLPLIVTPWFTAANEPPLTVTFLSKVPPTGERSPPIDVLPWLRAHHTRQGGARGGGVSLLAAGLWMTSGVGVPSRAPPGGRGGAPVVRPKTANPDDGSAKAATATGAS